MPLYEYECQACGHHLEAQQRMADAALLTCPACGKDQLQKLISASAFHLKGGGWYKDLYASQKPGEKSDSSGAGTPPATGSTGSPASPGGTGSTPSSTEAKPSGGTDSAKSSPTTSTPASPKPAAPSTPSGGKSGSGAG